ncbi:chloride channel [Mactra antiquata]
MTIIYQYKVATTTFFGFFKLLRRWRGSVYKLMFKETIIFCSLYTIISLTYRLALNPYQRKVFESIAEYCESYTSLIPVSFVLGFYVSVIVTRWWQQFLNVPWPDRTLYITGSYLVGRDERGRIYRRTVARYMLFALILILRSVSVSVMKRYPTMEHIIEVL